MRYMTIPGNVRLKISFVTIPLSPKELLKKPCWNDWFAKLPRAKKNTPDERNARVKLSTPSNLTVIESTKIVKEATNNTVCHHFKLRLDKGLSICKLLA